METPLSENMITGACLGLALEGWKPILVHARCEMMMPAMEHMVNSIPKWRAVHRDRHFALVVRAQVGRGWGQGPNHSQALHAMFAHLPGLRVLYPVQPADYSHWLEDILGWSLVNQIARYNEVEALTYAKNRSGIEQDLKEADVSNIRFHYIDLPSWLRALLKIQGGHQFYYFLWQIKAYFIASRLHKQHSFDLFHHITYANDWMASFIGALLPIPYIRGPGGGAHRTPTGFEGEYSLGGRLWEKLRSSGQWIFRHDPLFVKGQRRARAILLCNQESISNVPSKWAHKVHPFPVNGITTDDLAMNTPADSGNGVISCPVSRYADSRQRFWLGNPSFPRVRKSSWGKRISHHRERARGTSPQSHG